MLTAVGAASGGVFLTAVEAEAGVVAAFGSIVYRVIFASDWLNRATLSSGTVSTPSRIKTGDFELTHKSHLLALFSCIKQPKQTCVHGVVHFSLKYTRFSLILTLLRPSERN